MKKIILSTILSLAATFTTTAQIKVEVSETIELMAILARTAGNQEYNMDMAGQYTKDTEAWFAPYKQHATVASFQSMRNQHSISYDAVMSMAIHLEIDRGKIRFLGEQSDLQKRWKDVDIDDFIGKLNKFYTDTRFHDFFEQHRSFYDKGLKAYEANVMTYFHQDWYARFYGTAPTDRFRIVIGFTNGGGNYGPAVSCPDNHVRHTPSAATTSTHRRASPTARVPTWPRRLSMSSTIPSSIRCSTTRPTPP